MILTLQTFSTFVRQQASAIQATASVTLDLTIGSVIRAIIEAVSGVALQLQVETLDVAIMTRLATSSGTDVDTFVADFGFARLPATSATGQVTFSRYSTGQVAFVPVGTTVLTADGTLSYSVVADTNNPTYGASPSGYTIGALSPTVTVPVVCQTSGAGGNVVAGAISLIGNAVSAVDTVTNQLALSNGADAEQDAGVKARFLLYIASLARATVQSVKYAVQSVQQGLSYAILENMLGSTPTPGAFTIILDDGSGTPTSALIQAVTTAVHAVRPITSQVLVVAPTIVTVNVKCNLAVLPGAAFADAQVAIQRAITNYINGLGAGAGVSYLRIGQVALDASTSIAGITNLTVQGSTLDLPGTPTTTYKAATVSVS